MSHAVVIDDQKVVTLVASAYLSRLGLNVKSFNNGIDALQYFEHQDIDLVLTDLNMPHLSGFEVIRRIKKFHKKQVNIIAMSAVLNTSEDIQKAARLGVNDFILKPLDFEILAKKLSHFTKKEQTWSEWSIDPGRFSNKGKMTNNVELLAVSEVSLSVKAHMQLPRGMVATFAFDVLQEFEISTPLIAEVLDSVKKNDYYVVNLKILGLSERDAAKIRQLCRALDSFQLRINTELRS